MNKVLVIVILSLFSLMTRADPVWIDVRTEKEYANDHIKGDIRISHEQIVTEVEELFPDKETEIHLYCRSGRRAGIAMLNLKSAGYQNVFNAVGINDVRKERELIR